jgi:hypothetical protein
MGQRIEIDGTTVVDGTIVFTTNRSLTGTTGEAYLLFEADPNLDRVYVDQNAVVISKDGTWSDESVAAASQVIEDFFLFYPTT